MGHGNLPQSGGGGTLSSVNVQLCATESKYSVTRVDRLRISTIKRFTGDIVGELHIGGIDHWVTANIGNGTPG